MVNIKFKYRDKINYPNWSEQECFVSSLAECIRIYGLGEDCEYEILSIETEEELVVRRQLEKTACQIVCNTNFADTQTASVLKDNLVSLLKKMTFKRMYRAYEGDYRIIVEDEKGNECRYIINKDGSIQRKN